MRAIVPIFIESTNLLVETISDFKEFIDGDNELEKTVAIISGDTEVFLYGYALDDEVGLFLKKRQDMIQPNATLCDNRIAIPGKIIGESERTFLLCAGEYKTPNSHFEHSADIIGYHRQKTRIGFEVETRISGKVLTLKYVSLKKSKRGSDSKIIVESGSKLILESCIIDAITIEVQSGGVFEFKDVDFKGTISAIVQIGDGVIVNKGDARFDGVAYEYHFEKLTTQSAVGILDLSDQSDIRVYLERSKADLILLETDISFVAGGNININNKVAFDTNSLAIGDQKITMAFNVLLANKSISFSKNIIVSGDFKTQDAEDLNISLGIFKGSLETHSTDATISNTLFLPKGNAVSVEAEHSRLKLIECDFIGENTRTSVGIRSIFSQLHLSSTMFDSLDHTIDISKQKKHDAQSVDLDFEDESSTLSFYELTIKNCNSAIKSDGQLKSLSGEKIKLINVNAGVTLNNCQVDVTTLLASEIHGELFHITGQSAVQIKGEDSRITKTKKAFSFSHGTFAELFDLSIYENKDDPALTIEDAIVVAHNVKFRSNVIAVHIKRGGLFVNHNSKFNENTQTTTKDHEARPTLDYNEFLIEMEKLKEAQDNEAVK